MNHNICALFILIMLSSCLNDHLNPPAIECSSMVGDSLSFKKDIIPIFNTNCISSGCHNSQSHSGELNLESNFAYSQLNRKGSGFINTTDPNSSVLYSSIISISQPMPPTGQLGNCEILKIKKWMTQGGKNN